MLATDIGCITPELELTLNFLVAVVNMLNSSKEISEFSFENAAVKKYLLL